MGSGDFGGAGDVEFWRAKAERLAADNVVLKTRVADLEDQVGARTEKVSMLVPGVQCAVVALGVVLCCTLEGGACLLARVGGSAGCGVYPGPVG